MNKKLDMELLARELDAHVALENDLSSSEDLQKAASAVMNLILLKRQRKVEESERKMKIVETVATVAPIVVAVAVIGIGVLICNQLEKS